LKAKGGISQRWGAAKINQLANVVLALSALGSKAMPRLRPPSNLNVALETAAAGTLVFPAVCRWNENAEKLDKKPAIKEWQTLATTDPSQIKKWWSIFPDAVVGIELGRNGLFVLDLDRHPNTPDGVAAFKALCAGKSLPKCPMTRTPSHGLHLVFRQPPGDALGNATGSLPD
jgi:hypothetical protein